MPGLNALKAYVALVGSVATATFAVPNEDPKALHQSESVQPPSAPFDN